MYNIEHRSALKIFILLGKDANIPKTNIIIFIVHNILIKLFIELVVKFAKLVFVSSLKLSFRLFLFFLGVVL